MLTIFYDGNCPMCCAEMNKLKGYDKTELIHLVNIQQDNFQTLYPHVKYSDAMKILHGYYQGQLLLGLSVTHRAWTLVGKGFWVAPLNWPVIKTMSHYVYLLVAKYRHPISTFLSKLLGLKTTQCNSGICHDKSNNINNRCK
ncbi:thiol-disulfide oxidoreductase DCC family protein [Paraglaciecola sp. L3A3]|uniref:thiol-disulfide oxidoreductase DCC family protein n=1 Tax=Paraglaciecola sp. L3A3 TaxID=2686358 RepID=UPI00131D8149|nr:DUF393 domain-containing protein [Paraglaciecola sp. L3A3]